nr:hypothetical protein CFP56_09571 [Quercus suber]
MDKSNDDARKASLSGILIEVLLMQGSTRFERCDNDYESSYGLSKLRVVVSQTGPIDLLTSRDAVIVNRPLISDMAHLFMLYRVCTRCSTKPSSPVPVPKAIPVASKLAIESKLLPRVCRHDNRKRHRSSLTLRKIKVTRAFAILATAVCSDTHSCTYVHGDPVEVSVNRGTANGVCHPECTVHATTSPGARKMSFFVGNLTSMTRPPQK